MAELVVSPRAGLDIEKIWDYSADHWNTAQADRYVRNLQQVMIMLAAKSDVGFPHPAGDVAFTVKDAPDVDMAFAVQVKYKMRIPPHRPEPKAGQIQFMGITRRTARRMGRYMFVGALQLPDKAEGNLFARLIKITINGLLNIQIGLPTRNYRL